MEKNPKYLNTLLAAYLCNSLPLPANGMILYDPDTTSPYVFGTTASYICNEGYYLSQTSVRTCTGSGSASFWDGEEPQCIGKCIT